MNNPETTQQTTQQPSSDQFSTQIPHNPIAELSTGEAHPNNLFDTSNNANTSTKPEVQPPQNPIAQTPPVNTNVSSSPATPNTGATTATQNPTQGNDPAKQKDQTAGATGATGTTAGAVGAVASPQVKNTEEQKGVDAMETENQKKRDREEEGQGLNGSHAIDGPSSMVKDEHMTESPQNPSVAGKIKGRAEGTTEKVKEKIDGLKNEKAIKEDEKNRKTEIGKGLEKEKDDEKKRRKEYEGEDDEPEHHSLGEKIKEKWENVKEKIKGKHEEGESEKDKKHQARKLIEAREKQS